MDKDAHPPRRVPLPAAPPGTCRWCRRPVAKPASYWHPACLKEYKIRAWPGYARKCVLARDRGRCAGCGLDCLQLERVRRKARGQLRRRRYHPWVMVWLQKHFPWFTRDRRTAWEADHKLPVHQGGGACGLDNYQTLCVPCHQRKTKRDAEASHAARCAAALAPVPEPTPEEPPC